ncbi:MAG TPA: rhomboid family intramembrane serine protease [Gaiellaceae bacterium]|jgi:membrane associated rhomboid family serine protease
MATEERAETMVCYRHPNHETAVACSSCGRPICPDCMVFAAVGIKCPECAGRATGAKKTAQRIGAAAGQGAGAYATKTLIGLNVAVYLVQIAQANSIDGIGGTIFLRGYLNGPLVADGDWWRLVTSAFLHASPIHILFNMAMLWWFGAPLEALIGRWRFLAVYFVSILAGAAGALIVSPTQATVGASGAVFGILGAGIVLERRQIYVFGGSALLVAGFNLVLSFVISNVSVGGHIGGLVGGMLAMLAMSHFGRRHMLYGRADAATVAGLVGVAVLSVVVAYARVRGYA